MGAQPRIGFIGPGRVGATLAQAFHAICLSVVSVFGRDAERVLNAGGPYSGLTAALEPTERR